MDFVVKLYKIEGHHLYAEGCPKNGIKKLILFFSSINERGEPSNGHKLYEISISGIDVDKFLLGMGISEREVEKLEGKYFTQLHGI